MHADKVVTELRKTTPNCLKQAKTKNPFFSKTSNVNVYLFFDRKNTKMA